MKRNQVLGVVIDAIFAKTSEFDDIEDIRKIVTYRPIWLWIHWILLK